MPETTDYRLKVLEAESHDRKKDHDLLIQMGVDLKTIIREIKEIKDTIRHQDKRIDELERKDGQVAIKYWQVVMTSLLTGAAGYFLATLLR